MKSIIAQEGQSITDISIQEYGNTEFVGTLCKDNNIGLNDDLVGIDLIINADGLGNKKIKDEIFLNRIKPNNKFKDDGINFIYEDLVTIIYEDKKEFILE